MFFANIKIFIDISIFAQTCDHSGALHEGQEQEEFSPKPVHGEVGHRVVKCQVFYTFQFFPNESTPRKSEYIVTGKVSSQASSRWGWPQWCALSTGLRNIDYLHRNPNFNYRDNLI